jgi:hypothetical protein
VFERQVVDECAAKKTLVGIVVVSMGLILTPWVGLVQSKQQKHSLLKEGIDINNKAQSRVVWKA